MAYRGDGLNDIYDENLTVNKKLTTGSFGMPTGAGAAKVLTSDANGTGTWQAAAAGSGAPAGSIIMWSGDKSAGMPSGWLLCDGTAVSEGTYAALFAVIGHAFGGDPGGGNFNLPDLRQKFAWGSNGGDDPGLTGGSTDYTPSGSIDPHSGTLKATLPGIPPDFNGPATHTFTGDPATIIPPYLVVNFIIKT